MSYITFIFINIIISIILILDTNDKIIDLITNSPIFFNFFVNYNVIETDNTNSLNPSSFTPSTYNLAKGEGIEEASSSSNLGNSESMSKHKGSTNIVPNKPENTIAERRGMNKLSVTMPSELSTPERYKNMILANLSNYNLYTAQKFKFDEIVSRISSGTEPFFDPKAKELFDGDYRKLVKILQENTLHQKDTLKNHNINLYYQIREEALKDPDYISTAKLLEEHLKKAEEAALELAKLNSKKAEETALELAKLNSKKAEETAIQLTKLNSKKTSELSDILKAQINEEK